MNIVFGFVATIVWAGSFSLTALAQETQPCAGLGGVFSIIGPRGNITPRTFEHAVLDNKQVVLIKTNGELDAHYVFGQAHPLYFDRGLQGEGTETFVCEADRLLLRTEARGIVGPGQVNMSYSTRLPFFVRFSPNVGLSLENALKQMPIGRRILYTYRDEIEYRLKHGQGGRPDALIFSSTRAEISLQSEGAAGEAPRVVREQPEAYWFERGVRKAP